jgi:NADPH2:quinone reductase
MRAAIITERNAMPQVGDFREPQPQDGAVLIDVDTAGLGGWDVLGAYRLGVEYPCVIRGEGVGRTADGQRVGRAYPGAPGRSVGGTGQRR